MWCNLQVLISNYDLSVYFLMSITCIFLHTSKIFFVLMLTSKLPWCKILFLISHPLFSARILFIVGLIISIRRVLRINTRDIIIFQFQNFVSSYCIFLKRKSKHTYLLYWRVVYKIYGILLFSVEIYSLLCNFSDWKLSNILEFLVWFFYNKIIYTISRGWWW